MAIRVLLSRINHRGCGPSRRIKFGPIALVSQSHFSPTFTSSSINPPQDRTISSFDSRCVTAFSWHTSQSFQFHAASCRARSTVAETADYAEELEEINSKFAEAREEIELALESKETVYFDEDAEIARSVTQEVLSRFDALLARLPDDEKRRLQRSMGLKMEQLKAELAQLDD